MDTPGELIGESQETKIELGGIQCISLLDTGSTVSTVNEWFYREHLSSLPMYALENILQIECADGQMLPYAGYIEASVLVPDITGKENYAILLVVPDTEYGK